MKTFKLSLFLIFISSNYVFAQIVIDENDMPSANDIFMYSNGAMNNNDVSETGTNFLWDYSDLETLTNNEDTAKGLGDLETLFQLVFNNTFIFPDYVSDHYFGGQGFDLGLLTVEDVSNFYRKTSTSYEQTGFGASLNGQAVPVAYGPKDIIYEFPMSYGDTTFKYAFFEANIPTLGYWSEDIYRENEVNGWGTLMLPTGSFEVLKIKTTLNITDSLYVEFIMTGTSFDQPEQVEYKWIAKEMGVPVLTISEIGGQVINVQYLEEEDVVSSVLNIQEDLLSIYPNPAQNELNIKCLEALGQYSVKDLLGRTVISGKVPFDKSIDISILSGGKYIFELEGVASVVFIKD